MLLCLIPSTTDKQFESFIIVAAVQNSIIRAFGGLHSVAGMCVFWSASSVGLVKE